MADICTDRTVRRTPRTWVRVALASLLAALLTAGAYWYVTSARLTDDPYVDVGHNSSSTDVSGIVKDGDAASSPSCCVRSPRSRLSPQAIVGRPESRQDDLRLAALHLHLGADRCPSISTRIG